MATTVNIHLTFEGQSEEAFNFYRSVFGGEFSFVGRFKDTSHKASTLDTSKEKISFISLPISRDSILMASDVIPGFSPALELGNNYTISINPDSEEEAKRIYDGLSIDGKIITPLDDTFWGALYGMFIDKFGIRWAINYEYNTK